MFGTNFKFKKLVNGKYVFLYRKGRFADWVALDMKNPQYSWREGTDYYSDCMFDINDIERLKQVCSHKFTMSPEEFDELIFKLIKEDIVNEDSNRD
jgi:hypothetical protein